MLTEKRLSGKGEYVTFFFFVPLKNEEYVTSNVAKFILLTSLDISDCTVSYLVFQNQIKTEFFVISKSTRNANGSPLGVLNNIKIKIMDIFFFLGDKCDILVPLQLEAGNC